MIALLHTSKLCSKVAGVYGFGSSVCLSVFSPELHLGSGLCVHKADVFTRQQ